jgi:hypothetical protein
MTFALIAQSSSWRRTVVTRIATPLGHTEESAAGCRCRWTDRDTPLCHPIPLTGGMILEAILAKERAHVRPSISAVLQGIVVFAATILIASVGIHSPSGAATSQLRQISSGSGLTPPTSIASDCSTDATDALNSWFASLPDNSVVNLPKDGCYLVSNSPSSLLTIKNSNKLTINGNGTTLEQSVYNNEGAAVPGQILTLGSNINLAINHITVKGPSSNGGPADENDSGILMWQNNGVDLSGVTITTVEGDGLDVYPLGNQPGVNWNVTVEDSTIENIGYHAVTPEAVDGFTFENSTVSSGDIDAEVDFSCEATWPENCGTLSHPDIGVVNMTIKDNTFPNGMALEDGMSCLPVGNWAIEGNNLGDGGLDLQFDTTYSLSLSALTTCGHYSGLTIEKNTSTNNTLRPCCGSGSPYILVQGWNDVTIADNHLVFDPIQGLQGGAVLDFWGDSNVSIRNNDFANYVNLSTSDAPNGWPATTNVSTCGNTLGPRATPVFDSLCAQSPLNVSSGGGAPSQSKDSQTLSAGDLPPVETPEAPAAILLPAAATVILGTGVLIMRRQRRLRKGSRRPS